MMLRYKHRYRKTDVHWHNNDKCEWDIWDVSSHFLLNKHMTAEIMYTINKKLKQQ